jgi:hypothetical protein
LYHRPDSSNSFSEKDSSDGGVDLSGYVVVDQEDLVEDGHVTGENGVARKGYMEGWKMNP